jgi:hypothetical protein
MRTLEHKSRREKQRKREARRCLYDEGKSSGMCLSHTTIKSL